MNIAVKRLPRGLLTVKYFWPKKKNFPFSSSAASFIFPSLQHTQEEMATISLSALRGGRFSLFNPCPYPQVNNFMFFFSIWVFFSCFFFSILLIPGSQLSAVSSRSRKLYFPSKAITLFAQYSQAQDRFSSRLQGIPNFTCLTLFSHIWIFFGGAGLAILNH